jgi:hypothetical protein
VKFHHFATKSASADVHFMNNHLAPSTWHLQSHGRFKGCPSSLHPQIWQTLAFITEVLDLAAGLV